MQLLQIDHFQEVSWGWVSSDNAYNDSSLFQLSVTAKHLHNAYGSRINFSVYCASATFANL